MKLDKLSEDMIPTSRNGEFMRSEEYRSIASRWISGVSIVTAYEDDEPVGAAVSAVMPLSLSPAQFAISLAATSSTLAAIQRTGRFCINILSNKQRDYCRRFSGPRDERFKSLDYNLGALGVPVLSDALAYIECELESDHVGGDHVILVGAARAGASNDCEPLGYFDSKFWTLTPCA
ncbi:MAG: flavin reductase family protein [Erythrobacter sp.]